MIRLLIVDDHAVVRRGLGDLFSRVDDVEVVGAASDGEESVRLVDELAPGVVLMDLAMPTMDGVEATRRIKSAHPNVNVVVLTSFSERDRILDAIDAGASGYLLKDADPDELVRGVRAAAMGDAPFSPRAARTLLELGGRKDATRIPLTQREQEVLTLIGAGLTNKVIARRLGITEATVKAHLTRTYLALGVTDRTQAALWYERNGPFPAG